MLDPVAHKYFFYAADMAVGYHFGVGAPPILVYFSRDWDVHWGYGILSHSHMLICLWKIHPHSREAPAIRQSFPAHVLALALGQGPLGP